jgi:hypothetical protein
MLFHALPAPARSIRSFSACGVEGRALSLVRHLRGALGDLGPLTGSYARVRYTRNADFTDAVAQEHLDRLPRPDEILSRAHERDLSIYVRPVIA